VGVPISREPPHGHPPQFFNKGLGYLAISSSTHASRDERFPIARMVMRGILALFFAGAGFAHLLAPHELLKITPDWVPSASAVIFVTGFVELACAAALLTQSLRYWAGIALAIYSLCVWPANFKHALEGIQIAHVPSSWFYHGPRLAMQPVIMWWSLFSAGAVDWPWRR
jgi:uncharacterized membrane protein